MGTSELLCYRCIQDYANRYSDIAPRTASTIFEGRAYCWVHFAEMAGISDLLEIDTDDLHYPTGYSVLRKPVEEKKNKEKK